LGSGIAWKRAGPRPARQRGHGPCTLEPGIIVAGRKRGQTCGRCTDPQRRSAAPGTAARPRACAILAAMSNPLARARYLLAAHTPRQLPPDGGYEVAFAGRSNAGKSSALNALCQQNALARVSKTPGRTQQLVFFDVTAGSEGAAAVAPEQARYLVDLPGYGYAKVPQDLQAHWQAFIDGYFGSRMALRGLVVVMD